MVVTVLVPLAIVPIVLVLLGLLVLGQSMLLHASEHKFKTNKNCIDILNSYYYILCEKTKLVFVL
jgi:hypothetical protein